MNYEAEDDILSLAQKLISIPSVTSDTKQCEKVLKVALRELRGFPVRHYSSNKSKSLLFYTGKKASEKHRILLNGHLDVVPGHPEQFTPKIKRNRLYGRGSHDMKSGAAVLIAVFGELARDLPYDIALQLVTDEETGGEFGTAYQLNKGVNADFVITGESTNLKIIHESKGVLRIKLTATGQSAHSAYPWLGENALITLLKGINTVNTLYPIPRKEVFRTTATLTSAVSQSQAANKTPSDAEAIFDIRYIPKEKDRVLNKIKKRLPKHISLEVLRFDSPIFTPSENPYVTHLQKSYKVITGKKAPLHSTHGSSDIKYFSEKGIPAVGLGPIGYGQHSDDEWVDIKSMMTFYHILKDFLLTV